MNGDDLREIMETHQKREEESRVCGPSWRNHHGDRPNTIGACVIRGAGPSFQALQAMFAEENQQETEEEGEVPVGETCMICLEAIKTGAGTLSCGHSYHRSCIQDAIDHAYKEEPRLHRQLTTLPCPVCRAPYETRAWDAFSSARLLLENPAARRINGITPVPGPESRNREGLRRVGAGSRLRRSQAVYEGLDQLLPSRELSPRFHPDPRCGFCAR